MPPNKRTKARRRRKGRRKKERREAEDDHVSAAPEGAQGGLGASIGSQLGSWAEKGLKSLFGSGDYETEFEAGGFDVEDNSIVKPTSAANVPLLNSVDVQQDGMMRVRHREFLGDLLTGLDFPGHGLYEYGISPQNDNMFPWLSTIAGNFEQWIPHGIVFEFVSTCGNAVSSTNASLGSVSIATQYDVHSGSFKDKKQVLNHYFAVSGKTADNLMHAIECNPAEVQIPIFNTYPNGVPFPPGADLRLYFLGLTSVWNQGSQSQYTCGELWVTYDISLLKPRIARPILPLDITVADTLKFTSEHPDADFGEPQRQEVLEEKKLVERETEATKHLADREITREDGETPNPPPSPRQPGPPGAAAALRAHQQWVNVRQQSKMLS